MDNNFKSILIIYVINSQDDRKKVVGGKAGEGQEPTQAPVGHGMEFCF